MEVWKSVGILKSILVVFFLKGALQGVGSGEGLLALPNLCRNLWCLLTLSVVLLEDSVRMVECHWSDAVKLSVLRIFISPFDSDVSRTLISEVSSPFIFSASVHTRFLSRFVEV